MAAEERVMCFKRELFDLLGVFQGLSLEVKKYLPVITAPANLSYLPRSAAELDRRYKQLIPYVLVLCQGKILRYRRGKGGQESRLHGLFSVGVGGHIASRDEDLFSTYQEGMRRELLEEVEIDNPNAPAVALINDDSTEVGYVHFGVVHVLRVPNENVAGHRSGIVNPEFIPLADAIQHAAEYESWSRFCLEQMDLLRR